VNSERQAGKIASRILKHVLMFQAGSLNTAKSMLCSLSPCIIKLTKPRTYSPYNSTKHWQSPPELPNNRTRRQAPALIEQLPHPDVMCSFYVLACRGCGQINTDLPRVPGTTCDNSHGRIYNCGRPVYKGITPAPGLCRNCRAAALSATKR
jgi:hypothetical protein